MKHIYHFIFFLFFIDIDPKKILRLTEENIQKNYTIAQCCKPIPGDDILGYLNENKQIMVHKRQCPVAVKLKSSYGNRIVAAEWDTHKRLNFPITIGIKAIDEVGLLNQITQIISNQLEVNIRKMNIESNDGIVEGRIELYVRDVEDVKAISTNLKKISNIKSVTRITDN